MKKGTGQTVLFFVFVFIYIICILIIYSYTIRDTCTLILYYFIGVFHTGTRYTHTAPPKTRILFKIKRQKYYNIFATRAKNIIIFFRPHFPDDSKNIIIFLWLDTGEKVHKNRDHFLCKIFVDIPWR